MGSSRKFGELNKHPLRIDVLTLFPEAFTSLLQFSLLKKAQSKGLLKIGIEDIRQYTSGKHKTADDKPFGGGVGMVLLAEPVMCAVENLRQKKTKAIVLTPRGKPFTSKMARELAREEHLILVCGHYEEIDERFYQLAQPTEISLGDFVLSGGEIPALALIDGVARFIPGVVGKTASVQGDSFENSRLDYPHYTRPAEYRKRTVPAVLLSGNHKNIERYRRQMALRLTFFRRPDLLIAAEFCKSDRALLQEIILE